MKPNTQRWLGATAAAVAALLCWYLLSMEPEATSRAERRGPATAGLGTVRSLTAPPPLLRRDSPDFDRTLLERGQAWLDSRGRDAAGLIALWDLTGHGSGLLNEARKNYPTDPRVCMAMIQFAMVELYSSSPDGLIWMDRLIAAEPDNPEGLLQKARALARDGDDRAAVQCHPPPRVSC